MYRLQVHDARTTGMHWQIGKGGGFHHAVAEARGRGAARHRLPRRPARPRSSPRSRRCPRTCPSCCSPRSSPGERLERCPGPGPHPLVASAEIALVGHVPPRRAPARGAVRRPLRLLLAAPRLPGLPASSTLCRRRDAIFPATVVGKPRQEDFFIGDLLQELLVAALPAGHAGRASTSGPTARPGYHSLAAAVVQGALQARGDGLGLPHPRRGAALAHQVPARHRPAGRPAGLPRDARARPRAHATRDRPLRLLEPLDGHARLHRARGERGLEGRLARPRRPGARAAPRVPAAESRRRRR